MKNIRLITLLSFALLFVAVSCNDDDFVTYGNETSTKLTDPYLQILTPVISFQAGTPSYNMKFNVINGNDATRINSVDVYKIYTDIVTGNSSNEALLGTYPVTVGAGGSQLIDVNLTYDQLKEGLTVNGGPLPTDQTQLALGSGWVLRFEGQQATRKLGLNGSIQIAVLSRFAGLYKVIESTYWRIGVVTATWTGETRFIGSVNDTTFSHPDYWGNFAWAGKSFWFTLDESDNSISVPIDSGDGRFGGTRAINCTDDFAVFTNAPCTGSNVLIPDEVNGKHVIKLTYGYYTDGSGPREFYEVLEKL
jgi:hypothetical protein